MIKLSETNIAGRELAFAFGINLSVSKLGSVINNIISPLLVEKIGIIFAFWFGGMLCGFSLLCVLLTFPIDKAMDLRIARAKSDGALYIRAAAADQEGDRDQAAAGAKGGADYSPEVQIMLQHPMDGDGTAQDPLLSEEKQSEADDVSWRDVLRLPHIFWVLVVSCVVVYGCVLPFNNISSSLLLERDYFQSPPGLCSTYTPSHAMSHRSVVYVAFMVLIQWITITIWIWNCSGLPFAERDAVREQRQPARELPVLPDLPAAAAQQPAHRRSAVSPSTAAQTT